MFIHQGEMIDHIETNVATALAFVDKGERAVQISYARHRENRRVRTCIYTLTHTYTTVYKLVLYVAKKYYSFVVLDFFQAT